MTLSAPRPTGGYAIWASGVSGAAAITPPLASDAALGWQVGAVARSQYLNYHQNANGSWHQYLDDQAKYLRYERTVVDDFSRAIGTLGVTGAGATLALGPTWDSFGAFLTDDSAGGAVAIGTPSGLSYIKSFGGAVGPTDYFWSARLKVLARGSSGSVVEVGCLGSLSGQGLAAFTATGASGQFGLSLLPTGAAGFTSLALGVDPLSSAYHTYRLEKQGATLTATVDGVVVGAMPGASIAHSDFGVRVLAVGSLCVVTIDRLEMGISPR